MRLAIVGSTGLVGRELLDVLAMRAWNPQQLLLAASKKPGTRKQLFRARSYVVQTPADVLQEQPSLAIFSAGSATSQTWAPRFLQAGCWVIDNSSAWRMDPNCPLIVPEVNAAALPVDSTRPPAVIANPNCATIQLAVALHPLHERFGLQEVILSTYQSVSGAGQEALRQLNTEQAAQTPENQVLPHPIHNNLIPQIGPLQEGTSEEERKIQEELRKILAHPQLPIHVTCVRVPLTRSHSESIYIRTKKPITAAAAKKALAQQPGVVLYASNYPTPSEVAYDDRVHVGRIRQDANDPYGLQLWVVADNLRKGAATNALQIAEHLVKIGVVSHA